MTDVETDVVLYEVRDRIATLTLNRPDRLNAWTGGLARRYYALLEDAAADPDVRGIVVTGAGRGWCAGADMDSLQGGGASDDPGEVDGDHQGRDLPPLEHGASAGREGSERAHGTVLRLPRLQGRRAELRPAPEPRFRVAPGRLRGATERVELSARV